MNKAMLGLLSLSLVGCAHYRPTEKVVVLPFARDLVLIMQQTSGRAPASYELSVSEVKSTRRVYFSALYHQYLSLGKYLAASTRITTCPQFHHDKIETDGFITPAMSKLKTPQVSSEQSVFFPELAFNNKFSLKDHHLNIREELDILCEDGISDNYYKFDNLVTHYANKKSFHIKPDAMDAVLKIPVFANYYLVKMLQGNGAGFQFTHPEEKTVIRLTNTTWFENYVTEASRVRETLIQTTLVKRYP